ncbi:MAG: hypothetical protein CM15mP12_1500 [Gammaproteobacteria bacterium]|nr:MAG: hypothetical protein CM15mP12_1500 [Gammaproteobacteria bacterium]
MNDINQKLEESLAQKLNMMKPALMNLVKIGTKESVQCSTIFFPENTKDVKIS